MSEILCWRCGASLRELSLPLSRLDECPDCAVHLHVCRMCQFYAPAVTKACREDDAEEVRDKQAANFCDYFKVAPDAFDAELADADQAARQQLNSLFGGPDDSGGDAGSTQQAADDLFCKDDG